MSSPPECPPSRVFPPATALVRISFLVQSIYAATAARHDLTPQQAQLMCVLKDQPRGMAELGAILRLDKSSVGGLVDRVERRGLVRRRTSDADRRAITVSVTAKGKRRADAFYRETEAQFDALVAPLPAGTREAMADGLTRIVTAHSVPPVFGAVAG